MGNQYRETGFTLIEISIGLVIIGLVVGGVLVGQDLIRAAGIRAQISQIEKYQTAVNTFIGKYGALPGDMNPATASQFGFTPRPGTFSEGDGNGLIDGGGGNPEQGVNETGVFWVDLTTANGLMVQLIPGNFNSATWGMGRTLGGTINDLYFPQAALGNNGYVYVYSANGSNFFGISSILGSFTGMMLSGKTITVQQAYAIDRKVDDGMPLTGNVQATYVLLLSIAASGTASGTVAAAGSATTCYDNANNTSSPITYSINQNSGAGVNCALSFQFQ